MWKRSEKRRRGNAKGVTTWLRFRFSSLWFWDFRFYSLLFRLGSAHAMPLPVTANRFPSTHRRLVFFSVGCVDVSHFVCMNRKGQMSRVSRPYACICTPYGQPVAPEAPLRPSTLFALSRNAGNGFCLIDRDRETATETERETERIDQARGMHAGRTEGSKAPSGRHSVHMCASLCIDLYAYEWALVSAPSRM